MENVSYKSLDYLVKMIEETQTSGCSGFACFTSGLQTWEVELCELQPFFRSATYAFMSTPLLRQKILLGAF